MADYYTPPPFPFPSFIVKKRAIRRVMTLAINGQMTKFIFNVCVYVIFFIYWSSSLLFMRSKKVFLKVPERNCQSFICIYKKGSNIFLNTKGINLDKNKRGRGADMLLFGTNHILELGQNMSYMKFGKAVAFFENNVEL